MLAMTDIIVRIAIGIMACTMPTSTAPKLYNILAGACVMPMACNHWLITPLRPSSTIHAKVRTRKLVQNGNRIQNNSELLKRGEAIVVRYATG